MKDDGERGVEIDDKKHKIKLFILVCQNIALNTVGFFFESKYVQLEKWKFFSFSQCHIIG